jgi:heat shock protein beta
MQIQDVSKKGLKYGDEDEDLAEKKELAQQKIAFGPLIDWLKKDLTGQISDGESEQRDRANMVKSY